MVSLETEGSKYETKISEPCIQMPKTTGPGKKEDSSMLVNEIRQWEHQILVEGPAKANLIPELLLNLQNFHTTNQIAPTSLAAVHSLRRIFVSFFMTEQIKKLDVDIKRDEISGKPKKPSKKHSKSDPASLTATAKYTSWLAGQYCIYMDALKALVENEERGVTYQAPALRTMMELCKNEAITAPSPVGLAHNRAFYLTLTAVVNGGQAAAGVFVEEYVRLFADVRYHTFWGLCRLADENKNSPDTNTNGSSIIQLLLQMRLAKDETAEEFGSYFVPQSTNEAESSEESESEDEEHDPVGSTSVAGKNLKRKEITEESIQSDRISTSKKTPVHTLSGHRKVFSKACMACLKLKMDSSTYRQVLLWLPEHCIPNLLHPLKLADFLVDSYRQGGVIALMSLEALFILMTQYQLEYPDFYRSLYALLVPSTCYAKHRQRCFELVDVALSSIKLPAATIAAFLKRACRMALYAPPSGALYGLALSLRQLQRHGDLHTLIHKPLTGQEQSNSSTKNGLDFDNAEEEPDKSNALASSLWELAALQDHYYHTASTFAKGFQNKIDTKGMKLDMKEVTVMTYKSLFDQESAPKKKSVPTTFNNPCKLLPEKDLVNACFSF